MVQTMGIRAANTWYVLWPLVSPHHAGMETGESKRELQAPHSYYDIKQSRVKWSSARYVHGVCKLTHAGALP